jgi:hypothetical protein
MTRNIGRLDRAFRFILGLAILALVFVGPKTLWGYLGFIPLATALFSACPLYSLLGISTCERPVDPAGAAKA